MDHRPTPRNQAPGDMDQNLPLVEQFNDPDVGAFGVNAYRLLYGIRGEKLPTKGHIGGAGRGEITPKPDAGEKWLDAGVCNLRF